MGRAAPAALAALALVLALPRVAAAESSSAPSTEDRVVVTLDSGRRLMLFPPGSLFRPYVADPHYPDTGILLRSASSAIEDDGDRRASLHLGGRFGILRWEPAHDDGRSWQISFDAGIDAMFDFERSLDNIGWDGNYGLSVTTSDGGPLSWRFGLLHTSSHVGDEYAERTGRLRIGYTREELLLAVSWAVAPEWRTYFEAAWDPSPGSEALQEPWRLQTGLETERPGRLWSQRLGWYCALDVSSLQELDWQLDAALQIGIFLDSAGRRWRTGFEIYDGRVPIGEFYRTSETYVTVGLWVDL
ncbi:MAG: DUF1207 domain-containing protein [Thermoanaerobaculia bacterium]|nr:DUF1207 domain-containing protein [Thermoanaerobaculia bacterium]